ncbi:COX15/CtaA family protein [Arthrobacter mobilis]|uniref:Heme A synthase n=1 Tax=Arthrobacter mobilis TaxID=2724944 RepID=A0A7X6HCC3_9MICC|nr:COX15/CtaA family protein [Arthrobacter mobilis]NKX53865.1 heme A synthase [Arthrobacter mobilis]
MPATSAARLGGPAGKAGRLPAEPTVAVRALAVASLVSEILIVVTGGAVRLTASGLGCPTWPKCTEESLVATQEMGIHGAIEFGNRMLTFVLGVIAVAMLVSVWNMRRTRRDLFSLSLALLLGIPAQAVIGGITVWTHLNPWVVGCHFIVSMTMIAAATVLVHRAWLDNRAAATLVPARGTPAVRQLLWAGGVLTAVAIVLGVIVTGSGPHAGDLNAPRNGLDPDLATRAHAAPVYLLVACAVVLLVMVLRTRELAPLRRPTLLFAAAVAVQGAIGYLQHFTGLPIVLVGLHMLGASLLAAAATHAVYVGTTRRPLAAERR